MIADLLKPETFGFFARFLLAGFVFAAARARFVGQERPAVSETLSEAVVLSLINQMVYQLAAYLVPAIPVAPNTGDAAFFVEVLALPAVLGALSGWLISRNWVPAGFRKFVSPVSRPVPEAFEYAFVASDAPCYVIITFTDGREVYGYFGEQSYSGTDPQTGGIYIERLYSIDNDGQWVDAEPQRSAWVSLEDARSIEFLARNGA
jgi:hypothetical protein